MGNETLTDYILISQDKPFVEHFMKQPNGNWLYQGCGELEDILIIESIECELSLQEIYDRVKFETEAEEVSEN